MNAVGEAILWGGFGIAALGIAGMLIGIAVQLTGFSSRPDSIFRRTIAKARAWGKDIRPRLTDTAVKS